MKQLIPDHEIAKAINALRDVAIKYHGAQQLRERIAAIVRPLLKSPERITEQEIIEYLHSVREFITNGVEFGFIRLPEFPDDPANNLLPRTDTLIAKLTQVES